MFCSECGQKNEKNAFFCSECGTKLKPISIKNQNVPVKEKWENLSKKKKIGFLTIFSVLLFCIAFYIIGKTFTKPEKVAENYFLAYINYDASKIYDFLSVEKNEFTSKEMFVKLVNENIDEKYKNQVASYQIGKATLSADGLKAIVKINYTQKGQEGSFEETIVLTKEKQKKWFLFDSWLAPTKDSFETTENTKIQVMKGSKLYLNDVEVDQKYLSKQSPKENMDTYEMPALFRTYYKARVVYPFGETEEKISISSYSTLKTLTKLKLDVESENTLKDLIKSQLNLLYESAFKGTSFEEIETSLLSSKEEKDLKEAYEKLTNSLSRYKEISNVKFSEPQSITVKITQEGNLYVTAKLSYSYQVNVEDKISNQNGTDTVYMTYTYKEDSFKLIDAESLNTYFKKY